MEYLQIYPESMLAFMLLNISLSDTNLRNQLGYFQLRPGGSQTNIPSSFIGSLVFLQLEALAFLKSTGLATRTDSFQTLLLLSIIKIS